MEGGLGENETSYHDFYRTVINEFAILVKQEAELKQYTNTIDEFASNIVENVKKVFTRRNSEFHVQNHGDAWMNNLLWKHDEKGNLIDVIVVS